MVKSIQSALRKISTPAKAEASKRFFKTGPGQYGEDDVFLGVTIPEQRRIAKEYRALSLKEIEQLLKSKEHEFRMTALLIMTYQYPKASEVEKKRLYDSYLAHTKWINNWDLVDVSAPRIVGMYLQDKDPSVLFDLARSGFLWERRIAIIATLAFIASGKSETTLSIAELLLQDKHDLIHKAVGWMLREVGKRCGEGVERNFLDQYTSRMPRTMLRYAIERFDADTRAHYLKQ